MSGDRPDTPYPPDEFDRYSGPVTRRGAHRARPHPAVALLPALLVVVVVALVVIGVNALLGSGPPQSAATGNGPVGAETQPAVTDSPTTSSPTTTTASPTETAAPVDREAPITVLNGTTTSGLAGRAAAELSDAGWQVAGTGNHRDGGMPATTTVYYANDDLAATAEAVAADLGGADVALDAELADSVTVVLREDYEG